MSQMDEQTRQAIANILDAVVTSSRPIGEGVGGAVYRVALADGRQVVAKADESGRPQLALEGDSLRYLAEHSRLPVPAVLHNSERLLLLEFLPGESHFSAGAQRHAAELLADLHSVSAPAYGFERDTQIGGLLQPNPWTDSWLAFFREQRLLYLGRVAMAAGRLPGAVMGRLERLGGRLAEWVEEPPEGPSLIHGDIWAGNVLATGDRITGFLDPACYYGDAEMELAFITMFNTFSRPFFERYGELRAIRPGFWEVRRDIYNLYPWLVHVRLFGDVYLPAVIQTLSRFGF
jgi:fructosamine-3-kinase